MRQVCDTSTTDCDEHGLSSTLCIHSGCQSMTSRRCVSPSQALSLAMFYRSGDAAGNLNSCLSRFHGRLVKSMNDAAANSTLLSIGIAYHCTRRATPVTSPSAISSAQFLR